eukprot:scpid85543/ scgid27169/ 
MLDSYDDGEGKVLIICAFLGIRRPRVWRQTSRKTFRNGKYMYVMHYPRTSHSNFLSVITTHNHTIQRWLCEDDQRFRCANTPPWCRDTWPKERAAPHPHTM